MFKEMKFLNSKIPSRILLLMHTSLFEEENTHILTAKWIKCDFQEDFLERNLKNDSLTTNLCLYMCRSPSWV